MLIIFALNQTFTSQSPGTARDYERQKGGRRHMIEY